MDYIAANCEPNQVFFMIGLSVYLKGLNKLIFRCVVLVFSLTGLFYASTTLLALFMPFCPFHNALSSVLQGGLDYIYWLWFEDPSQDSFWFQDAIWRRLSSKAQEESVFNNTTPDALTGHALRWLITSSESPESADGAIKSVACIASSSAMKALLDTKPIMSLVTQRFTSCFQEFASMGTSVTLCLNDSSKDSVLHYGQALFNLAIHTVYNNPFGGTYGGLLAHEQHMDEDMVEAVRLRFKHLAECDEPRLVALGLTGTSAWGEFVDLSGPSRFDRGSNLSKLVEFIRENEAWGQANPPKVEPLVVSGLFRALIFEAAHWMHDIDYSVQAQISRSLADMAKTPVTPIQNLLATSLAVMATTFSNSLLQCHATPSKASPIALEKQLRARDMARQYTECEDLRIRDADGLLLLGLVGLLELHGLQGFGDNNEEIIQLVADQLPTFDILDRRAPIRLSAAGIFPGQFDVRLYAVETLVRLLSDEPYLSQDYQLPETSRACLLKALVDKTHIWTSWGDRLIKPIERMLGHVGNGPLRTQCEAAQNAYRVVSQLRQPINPRP
ncbi:hypothetical protein FS749_003852 [Ceratobasidium sp. UAMH 11750]|nr:hypothetical protein FS749_003852 [Ceratobasidium sp. UAMH 11750]